MSAFVVRDESGATGGFVVRDELPKRFEAPSLAEFSAWLWGKRAEMTDEEFMQYTAPLREKMRDATAKVSSLSEIRQMWMNVPNH